MDNLSLLVLAGVNFPHFLEPQAKGLFRVRGVAMRAGEGSGSGVHAWGQAEKRKDRRDKTQKSKRKKKTCGFFPARRSNFFSTCFVKEPRQPSANTWRIRERERRDSDGAPEAHT